MKRILSACAMLVTIANGISSYAQAPASSTNGPISLLQRIIALEQDARFSEAIQLYEDNLEAAAADPDSEKLKAKAVELREEKKNALQLSFAVQQLGSDEPLALQAAKDELIDGGEAGAIYIRKAVREGKGKIATEAISLLEGLTDPNTVATLARRLKKEPNGELAPALIRAVGASIRSADAASLKSVALNILPLSTLVQNDPQFNNRDIISLFTQVMSQWCNGDPKQFAQIFGRKDLYDTLKNYIKQAQASKDTAVLTWYGGNAALFGLESSLMGWWRFDEDSGAIARDSSGQGNDGKINGAAEWVPGVIGKALRFDGKSIFVSLGNPQSLQITNDMTIAMWLKPAALGLRQNPFNKAYGGEGTMTLEPEGVISFFCGTGGADRDPYQTFVMTNTMVTAQWAHIALVRDTKNKKLYWYKDGRLTNEAEATYPIAQASAQEALIGDGYVEPFNGLIDDARIYSRVLSAEEVRSLFAAAKNQAR